MPHINNHLIFISFPSRYVLTICLSTMNCSTSQIHYQCIYCLLISLLSSSPSSLFAATFIQLYHHPTIHHLTIHHPIPIPI